MAAAVAATLALTPMGTPIDSFKSAPAGQVAGAPAVTGQVAMISASPVPSATAGSETGSDAEFAYVFTPTVDEDVLI